jgi:DNA-binding transcriptional regulator YdaS (Cro superfamily)
VRFATKDGVLGMMTVDAAIKVFGSRRKLADALGISTQAIYQWGEYVPKLRAYEILEIEGKFNRPESSGE